MEHFTPDNELDSDVVEEILRVKERVPRSDARRSWVTLSVFALGAALVVVAMSIGAMSGELATGLGWPVAVAGGVGVLLMTLGAVAAALGYRTATREYLDGGGLTDVERHYQAVYPGEFAEAERREKITARRREQEAALKKGAASLADSRAAIARERSRRKGGSGA